MSSNKQHFSASVIYLLLLLLSIATYQVAETMDKQISISIGVLIVAVIKAFLISEYFMQLKQVNGFWRWSVPIWLIILAIGLFMAFTF